MANSFTLNSTRLTQSCANIYVIGPKRYFDFKHSLKLWWVYIENGTNYNINKNLFPAMVTAMDEGIGRVIDTLENTGMMNNTLVVFMSDVSSLGCTTIPVCQIYLVWTFYFKIAAFFITKIAKWHRELHGSSWIVCSEFIIRKILFGISTSLTVFLNFVPVIIKKFQAMYIPIIFSVDFFFALQSLCGRNHRWYRSPTDSPHKTACDFRALMMSVLSAW